MTDPATAKDPLRYRLYYWLMDICLVFAGIGLVDFFLTRIYGDFPADATPVWYVVLGVVTIFVSFLVAPFLILARFMRDEYADQLWHRTTVVLVYVTTVMPYVLLISAWITFFITQAEEAPFPFDLWMKETSWWNAIARAWQALCLLFIAIFQFLRWRDSR